MRTCVLCGKSTKIGMDTTHKHGGQWSMRAPRTQKLWKPNLQVARVEVEGLGVKKLKFCIKCLRIVKAGDAKSGMKIVETPKVEAEAPKEVKKTVKAEKVAKPEVVAAA